MTAVIKGGTKQYHATGWEFLRNDALDARNWFNPSPQKVAELRFHTYGFNVGGPVDFWKKEHKTFLLLQHGMAQPDSGANAEPAGSVHVHIWRKFRR